MQDQISSTHLHSHSDASRLRSPKETSRRPSNVRTGPPSERSFTPLNSGESDRNRHWNTILGHPPHAESHSSQSLSLKGADQRKADGLLRSQSNRSSSPTSSPRLRVSSQIGPDYDPSSRPHRDVPQKPFACDQCGRRFERRGHLKSHIDAVHELQQPYICHYSNCHRRFSHQSSLNRHLKGVHHFYPGQNSGGDLYQRK